MACQDLLISFGFIMSLFAAFSVGYFTHQRLIMKKDQSDKNQHQAQDARPDPGTE